jgi:phosphate uptake regulator
LQKTKYDGDLQRIEEAIRQCFGRVRKDFEKGDEADSQKMLNEYAWINKLCDQHVFDIINEKKENRSSGKNVALVLYFRYLKRINSHLRNIATSIVNPFHRIGFVKKKKS